MSLSCFSALCLVELTGRRCLCNKDRTAVDTHTLHNKHTWGFSQGCFLLAYSRLAALLGKAETRGGNPYTSVMLKCPVAIACLFCTWLRSCQRPPPVLPCLRCCICQPQPQHGLRGGTGLAAAAASPGLPSDPTLTLKTPLLRPSFCCCMVFFLVRDDRQQGSKANALR